MRTQNSAKWNSVLSLGVQLDALEPNTSGYLVLDNSPLFGDHSAYQLQLLLHVLINAGNQTLDV